ANTISEYLQAANKSDKDIGRELVCAQNHFHRSVFVLFLCLYLSHPHPPPSSPHVSGSCTWSACATGAEARRIGGAVASSWRGVSEDYCLESPQATVGPAG